MENDIKSLMLRFRNSDGFLTLDINNENIIESLLGNLLDEISRLNGLLKSRTIEADLAFESEQRYKQQLIDCQNQKDK